jgi:competence protein ComEA
VELRRTTTEWIESLADRLGVSAWSLVVGTVAVLAAGIGGWWALAAPMPPPVDQVLPRVDIVGPVVTSPPVAANERRVVVHVAGAVSRPGIHELAEGSRVVYAIEAAGGLTGEADRERLNLAAPVVDGQRVWVPRVGESEPAIVGATGGVAGAAGAAGGGIVNLNTADSAALETLPGVGPSIAAAIIRYRDDEGPFQRVDDLLAVPGIGPSRLAQLVDQVTL